MRLQIVNFILLQLKYDSEPFCTQEVYSDMSTAGFLKGTVTFIGIRAEQEYVLRNVPTKPIRALQPTFIKLWPRNVTHDGFTEYDTFFLREYWLSGDFGLCVISPRWPEWILMKPWTQVKVTGRISQDKKAIVAIEIHPHTT